jgi:glucose/arabinose dehydrogenase
MPLLFAALMIKTQTKAVTQAIPIITVNSILQSGFSQPVGVKTADDGSRRLFVVEQTGKIKIVKSGAVLSTPFLDVSSMISCCGERGLLGLAFHPNFANNGYFFINYTRSSDGATVIARYQVYSNPDVVDPATRQVILEIGQPYSNHNGGQLAFGKDGFLYIGMGDGGSGGDPLNNAQNLNSLLGKMLRIDIDHPQYPNLYSIPPGNLQGEIWALGLRNPWSWSFDRLTGDLFIGDVGQNAWEEIDFYAFSQPSGSNFGWSCLEGNHNYNLTRPPCNQTGFIDTTIRPVAEYNHSEGQSVTGGFIYRGSLYPNMFGRYFYADFSTGKIWSIYQTSTSPVTFSAPFLHEDADFLVSCFGEDENGELYICDYYGGKIRLLQDASGASPNLEDSTITSSPQYADFNEQVEFTLNLVNTGGASPNPIKVDITVPIGLVDVVKITPELQVLSPTQLRWSGLLTPNTPVAIIYRTKVNVTNGRRVTGVDISGTDYSGMTLKHALLIPQPVLSTTSEDFRFPGTQPASLVNPIFLPSSCDVCHTAAITDSWQGSMMAQAGRDPLFWAAVEVANHDAPGSGEYCLRCHTPKGWLEGRSNLPDGSNLLPADLDAGVACEICHRAVDPFPSTNSLDQAVARDAVIRSNLPVNLPYPVDHVGSAMMIIDPEDYRRGPFNLGVDFPYHPNETYQTEYLGGNPTNYVTRSRLCGTCHNVDNPILFWDEGLQEYLPNTMNLPAPSFSSGALFPVETTFDEWLNSSYTTSAACQDCHMPDSKGFAAESFFNPVYRDCDTTGCLPVHELVGGNTWIPQLLLNESWRLNRVDLASLLTQTISKARSMLYRAAVVKVSPIENSQTVIRVTNLTGHKLPTGYAEGRRIWLNVRGYDVDGNVTFEKCSYDFVTGVLLENEGCRVYEIKQGVSQALLAAVPELSISPGPSFHFVLNNKVFKDNRIPPLGYSPFAMQTRGLAPVENGVIQTNLYPGGRNYDEITYTVPADTIAVKAFLYYQTASKEYIDFLNENGGLDSETLYSLWQDLKSPPELIAWGSYPIYSNFLPWVSLNSKP